LLSRVLRSSVGYSLVLIVQGSSEGCNFSVIASSCPFPAVLETFQFTIFPCILRPSREVKYFLSFLRLPVLALSSSSFVLEIFLIFSKLFLLFCGQFLRPLYLQIYLSFVRHLLGPLEERFLLLTSLRTSGPLVIYYTPQRPDRGPRSRKDDIFCGYRSKGKIFENPGAKFLDPDWGI
jgi:hypothetical protein